MKLSSISLIAAALAATAGCAIAVPRPCALEQINSFQSDPVVHRHEPEVFALERNIEPVDNLVTRGGVSNAEAADIVRSSASLHRQAAIMADAASEKAKGSWKKRRWEKERLQLTKDANQLSKLSRQLRATPGISDQRHMEHHLVNIAKKNLAVQAIATLAHDDIYGVRPPHQGGHPSH